MSRTYMRKEFLRNVELRETAKKARIPLWKIAQELGISEASLTRMLRVELPAEKQDLLMAIIENLSKGDEE